ncbi:MAG: TonB-dependent receptor, partial [Rhizomicrobium sp.]
MKLKARILCGAAVALWSAVAANADNAADTDAATGIETVVVLGMGETKQIQTISQPDITLAVPGTSPIKVISKLPGVNYEAADPYGAYEWAVRISVRGFNQNQMGFTLDDVPLGDMSYGNHNGLHISRAISSENIGGADLAQGAGALGTASTSNLGGTLAFHSAQPRSEAGVYAASSYGSDNTYHEFLRIDSGTLAGGGSGYVSYGIQYGDKWKGDGTQKQQQINAKYVQPLGTLTLSGTFDYSMRRENDYQDLSLALIRRVGYNWDNISNDWQKALQIASVYQAKPSGDCAAVGGGDGSNQYPSPVQCVDDAYYNASGLRNDALGSLTANWDILSNLTLHVTGYGHNNKGMGTWDTPYVSSPDGTPMAMRTTEYGINRYGVVGSLKWTYQDHTVEAGYWYENNNFHQARRYYAMSASSPRGDLVFPSHAFATSWEYKFNTVTQVVHLQDTWQVSDALKVEFGFKAQKVNNVSHAIVGTISGKIGTEGDFLP